MFILEIRYRGGETHRYVLLPGETYTIGRKACRLPLPETDQSISRHHATIVVHDMPTRALYDAAAEVDITVEDFSKHGTYVDGELVGRGNVGFVFADNVIRFGLRVTACVFPITLVLALSASLGEEATETVLHAARQMGVHVLPACGAAPTALCAEVDGEASAADARGLPLPPVHYYEHHISCAGFLYVTRHRFAMDAATMTALGYGYTLVTTAYCTHLAEAMRTTLTLMPDEYPTVLSPAPAHALLRAVRYRRLEQPFYTFGEFLSLRRPAGFDAFAGWTFCLLDAALARQYAAVLRRFGAAAVVAVALETVTHAGPAAWADELGLVRQDKTVVLLAEEDYAGLDAYVRSKLMSQPHAGGRAAASEARGGEGGDDDGALATPPPPPLTLRQLAYMTLYLHGAALIAETNIQLTFYRHDAQEILGAAAGHYLQRTALGDVEEAPRAVAGSATAASNAAPREAAVEQTGTNRPDAAEQPPVGLPDAAFTTTTTTTAAAATTTVTSTPDESRKNSTNTNSSSSNDNMSRSSHAEAVPEATRETVAHTSLPPSTVNVGLRHEEQSTTAAAAAANTTMASRAMTVNKAADHTGEAAEEEENEELLLQQQRPLVYIPPLALGALRPAPQSGPDVSLTAIQRRQHYHRNNSYNNNNNSSNHHKYSLHHHHSSSSNNRSKNSSNCSISGTSGSSNLSRSSLSSPDIHGSRSRGSSGGSSGRCSKADAQSPHSVRMAAVERVVCPLYSVLRGGLPRLTHTWSPPRTTWTTYEKDTQAIAPTATATRGGGGETQKAIVTYAPHVASPPTTPKTRRSRNKGNNTNNRNNNSSENKRGGAEANGRVCLPSRRGTADHTTGKTGNAARTLPLRSSPPPHGAGTEGGSAVFTPPAPFPSRPSAANEVPLTPSPSHPPQPSDVEDTHPSQEQGKARGNSGDATPEATATSPHATDALSPGTKAVTALLFSASSSMSFSSPRLPPRQPRTNSASFSTLITPPGKEEEANTEVERADNRTGVHQEEEENEREDAAEETSSPTQGEQTGTEAVRGVHVVSSSPPLLLPSSAHAERNGHPVSEPVKTANDHSEEEEEGEEEDGKNHNAAALPSSEKAAVRVYSATQVQPVRGRHYVVPVKLIDAFLPSARPDPPLPPRSRHTMNKEGAKSARATPHPTTTTTTTASSSVSSDHLPSHHHHCHTSSNGSARRGHGKPQLSAASALGTPTARRRRSALLPLSARLTALPLTNTATNSVTSAAHRIALRRSSTGNVPPEFSSSSSSVRLMREPLSAARLPRRASSARQANTNAPPPPTTTTTTISTIMTESSASTVNTVAVNAPMAHVTLRAAADAETSGPSTFTLAHFPRRRSFVSQVITDAAASEAPLSQYEVEGDAHKDKRSGVEGVQQGGEEGGEKTKNEAAGVRDVAESDSARAQMAQLDHTSPAVRAESGSLSATADVLPTRSLTMARSAEESTGKETNDDEDEDNEGAKDERSSGTVSDEEDDDDNNNNSNTITSNNDNNNHEEEEEEEEEEAAERNAAVRSAGTSRNGHRRLSRTPSQPLHGNTNQVSNKVGGCEADEALATSCKDFTRQFIAKFVSDVEKIGRMVRRQQSMDATSNYVLEDGLRHLQSFLQDVRYAEQQVAPACSTEETRQACLALRQSVATVLRRVRSIYESVGAAVPGTLLKTREQLSTRLSPVAHTRQPQPHKSGNGDGTSIVTALHQRQHSHPREDEAEEEHAPQHRRQAKAPQPTLAPASAGALYRRAAYSRYNSFSVQRSP